MLVVDRAVPLIRPLRHQRVDKRIVDRRRTLRHVAVRDVYKRQPKDRERYFTLIAKGLGGVLSPGKSWAEK